eukprot:9554-Heterococcus_DN1.PRE.13
MLGIHDGCETRRYHQQRLFLYYPKNSPAAAAIIHTIAHLREVRPRELEDYAHRTVFCTVVVSASYGDTQAVCFWQQCSVFVHSSDDAAACADTSTAVLCAQCQIARALIQSSLTSTVV